MGEWENDIFMPVKILNRIKYDSVRYVVKSA